MAKPHLRTPKIGVPVSARKTPKVAVDPNEYYKKRPVWRIGSLCMAEPDECGWHLVDEPTLHDVRDKLSAFEKLTWREILVTQRHRHHPIAVSAISVSAQKSLKRLGHDVDEVVSLRLSGAVRVFGVMENEVFNVLWWDPNHNVCPAVKKHT